MRMQELKKIYSINTKKDIKLGFVSCPIGTSLIEWQQSPLTWNMTVSKVNGEEERIYFVKEKDEQFKYVGRLLSLTESDYSRLVEKMEDDEQNVHFKDYNYNKFNLMSALTSVYSAAMAAQFPIEQCNNPVILLSTH